MVDVFLEGFLGFVGVSRTIAFTATVVARSSSSSAATQPTVRTHVVLSTCEVWFNIIE